MARPRALSDFIAEANEILEALGRDLLVLDERRGQDPDPDLLNSVFRAASKTRRASPLRDSSTASSRLKDSASASPAIALATNSGREPGTKSLLLMEPRIRLRHHLSEN